MLHILKQIIQMHHFKNQSSKPEKKEFFTTEKRVDEYDDYNWVYAKNIT